MNTAAELRKQIESALAERIPAALSMRPAAVPELVSCGIAEVDAALGGGLPLGGISELTGAASSGRTTLAWATLAGITVEGGSGAYVDVSDSFDPLSASALGVDLSRHRRSARDPGHGSAKDRFWPGRVSSARRGHWCGSCSQPIIQRPRDGRQSAIGAKGLHPALFGVDPP
jgi:RecA/RadA recombinase